jgi:hypothetical protein
MLLFTAQEKIKEYILQHFSQGKLWLQVEVRKKVLVIHWRSVP